MTKGKANQRGRTVPMLEKVTVKPKMLAIGDFPVKTGFGTVMANLLPYWRNHFDIYILGVNYFGDWTPEVAEYKIWPASGNGGDIYGISKLVGFASQVNPDVIFILNDPWVLAEYMKAVKKYKEEHPNVKVFVYTPVDAPNINEKFVKPLNIVDTVITYTEFGRSELLFSGLETKHAVIPHGVDNVAYKPIPKIEAKSKLGIPLDNYVILTNNRNQPRKSLDTTVQYIAEWIKRDNLPLTVRWYFHGALMDEGWDIVNLVAWYGIQNRLIVSAMNLSAANTLPLEHMQIMNSAADVFFTTTKAEG